MSRLWIFIEDRYVRYELNHDFIYESLKVHIADCVFVNDVCLDSGECKTIDRYLVYLDASKLCWKCMEVHDVFSIGRDLSNTYVCSDLRVSSFHARIQNGVIEDISSLNGTYVNQKKISSYVLDVGDEILIGFEWFIYLNSYILVHSVEMDLDDISYAVLHTSDYQKNYQNIISPSIFHYDLDLPLTMARVSKSHILNAIGPSFMILVSGLISLLLSSFIAETSVVFSSFLSSLSMAVVFGGYGLWNRAYQYKQGILENKNLEKKYVKYLERIEQQMVSDKCTYSKQFMQYLEWALHSYHCMSEFTFYCGDVLKNWSSFNERAISYDRYEEELVVLRQSLMEKYFDVISHPYFLKKNDVVWIHCSLSDFYTLFEYWTWYCDSGIKWAWLGDFKGVERVLLDVHCQSDGKFLYSEDEMSLLSMINEPVVLVTNQVNGLNGKYEAVIYIGQEKPVYPCISVIPKSLPSFDIDKRRFVQSQYAMHDDYFFRDLISHGVIRSSCFVSRIVVGHDASYLPYKMDFIEDGPHGLVAGTTGSGKSEWLSFILMMMIWHNSPFDFQYILIDFKGGSFGQSLYSFAHCAGMITNLDKKEMNRFFLSMQREVEKRQEILFKQKVSDIHDLDCEHRLSRLWIVVDEFAQLKMSYPEMMKQLQELARIGRSLGIHLILSTQKPRGVVDDQIWANAKFKACFKVANQSDSREVLQNDLAYSLKNPGSFILQTSENEIALQGYYLKSILNDTSFKEMSIHNEVICQSKSKGLICMDVLRDAILSLHETRHWIILPKLDPGRMCDDFVVDMPVLQKQVPLDFHGRTLILYEDESIWKNVLAYFSKETIYLFNKRDFISYCDYYFEKLRYFNLIEDGICLCEIDHDFDVSILPKRCICLMRDIYRVRGNMDMRISYHVHDVDKKRNFFGQFLLPEWDCIVSLYDGLYELYCRKIAYLEQRQGLMMTYPLEPYCIGFEQVTDRPVYLDPMRKVMVLYKQNSCRAWISNFVLNLPNLHICFDLQETGDVYVLKASDSVFGSSAFEEMRYDLQIIWVGNGFADFAYNMHLRPNSFSDCVLYFNGMEGVAIDLDLYTQGG